MADDIGDDEPIPLSKAAEIFFRGHITKSALRTEARKGNLDILRIANKDFVTRRAIQRMIEKCTIKAAPTPMTKPSMAPMTAREALKIMMQPRRKQK